MKIVVLGGGISTERDVSLSSSRMIYEALKKKGHQAILLDVYLGYEGDYEDIFEKNIDWAENIGGITESNPDISSIKAPVCAKTAEKAFSARASSLSARWLMWSFWGCMEKTEKTARCRRPLTCWESGIPARIMSAPPWPWIKASQRNCSPFTPFRLRQEPISKKERKAHREYPSPAW